MGSGFALLNRVIQLDYSNIIRVPYGSQTWDWILVWSGGKEMWTHGKWIEMCTWLWGIISCQHWWSRVRNVLLRLRVWWLYRTIKIVCSNIRPQGRLEWHCPIVCAFYGWDIYNVQSRVAAFQWLVLTRSWRNGMRSPQQTFRVKREVADSGVIYWLVVWNINSIFPYIGNNHPNWLSYYFRGVAQPPTRSAGCYFFFLHQLHCSACGCILYGLGMWRPDWGKDPGEITARFFVILPMRWKWHVDVMEERKNLLEEQVYNDLKSVVDRYCQLMVEKKIRLETILCHISSYFHFFNNHSRPAGK